MNRTGNTRRLLAGTVVLLLGAALTLISTPGETARAAGSVTLTGYGADSCTAPSQSQMNAFWTNTRFSYWGIYIGGSDRGCSQPNLTSAWVTKQLATGWDLLPIWVGPQNPCTSGQASYFSTDATTAASQGKSEALKAYNAWKALGGADSVPIDYDLEAPATDTATCRAAAKAFVDAWVAQLHVAPAQTAGVYSSACAGYLDDFATIAHKPDFIHAADWDGSPSTGGISCVSSSHWTAHQRHKQYQGGHNETMNGVTLNIDSDCANGPVYGNASHTSTTQACAPAALTASARRAVAASRTPTTWHSATWTSGGPLGSSLLRDGTPVHLAGLSVRRTDVSPAAPTVGTPQVLGDGSLLVPVTRHAGGRVREVLYTSRDGRHFTRRATVPLSAGLASPGVAAPVAVRGSRVVVLDPATHRVTEWTAAGTSTYAVRGLPVGVESVRFTGVRTGEAVVPAGACAAKAGCSSATRVLRTSDGGRTWR